MTQSLRVVFAGTPEFAAAALAAIHAAGFHVPLVLTQPDRPAGRGMKLAASPVKRFAVEHGLPVAQPTSLRRNGKYPEEAVAAIERLKATPHDVMVVAAYGLILPQEVLDIPPLGAINIHGSLLPRWRGAAPIHRALEAGAIPIELVDHDGARKLELLRRVPHLLGLRLDRGEGQVLAGVGGFVERQRGRVRVDVGA